MPNPVATHCCPWASDHRPNARPNHTRKPLERPRCTQKKTFTRTLRDTQLEVSMGPTHRNHGFSILKYTKTYWNILKWCNFGWFGVPPLKAQTQFNQFNPTGLHPLPLSSSRALISRKIHNFRLLKNFVRPRAALGCTMSQAIRGSNIRKTVENPCSFIRWLRNIWQNTTPLLLQRLKILYIVTLTVSRGTSSPVVGCLRFCSCMLVHIVVIYMDWKSAYTTWRKREIWTKNGHVMDTYPLPAEQSLSCVSRIPCTPFCSERERERQSKTSNIFKCLQCESIYKLL